MAQSRHTKIVYGTFRESGVKGTHPTFYGITDDATGIGSVDGQNLATAL
jgi:hypothetical protein